MTTATDVDEIRRLLAKELRARTEWDEQPAVYTLHRGPDGLTLVWTPLPETVWKIHGHPPTALNVLAIGAEKLRQPNGTHPLLPANVGQLVGAAFRYEAYAINEGSQAPAVQEAVRRREIGGSVPRFRDIKGRIEQRCMTAVGLDGMSYMASADRLTPGGTEAGDPRSDYYLPLAPQHTGRVVDAVHTYLRAVAPDEDR
jgi:hypothetical protein